MDTGIWNGLSLYSYTVAEAAKLFGVHRNTVRAWIKGGLDTVRVGKMILILGDELRSFLQKRRAARRTTTPLGWLYCLKCRAPRAPAEGLMELIQERAGTANVRAICGHCDTLMHRRVSLRTLAETGFASLATGRGDCT